VWTGLTDRSKKKVGPEPYIIPFWFKRPDQLLQSQLPKLIDISKLKDLMHVDIIVGGDHGVGKFRMTLKVNFCLQDTSTVSFLTQTASVLFSKDDTEILKETVLKPIGIGLWLIAEGARFIVNIN
jgi:hypothetical protein